MMYSVYRSKGHIDVCTHPSSVAMGKRGSVGGPGSAKKAKAMRSAWAVSIWDKIDEFTPGCGSHPAEVVIGSFPPTGHVATLHSALAAAISNTMTLLQSKKVAADVSTFTFPKDTYSISVGITSQILQSRSHVWRDDVQS